MTLLVPAKFPTLIDPSNRRLALVGEHPGPDEESYHVCSNGHGYSAWTTTCPHCGAKATHSPQPFVGASGRLLKGVLAGSGLSPDSCLLTNLCQTRPDSNDSSFDWDGPELEAGRLALQSDLQRFNPNCILILGRLAFRYFNPGKCYPVRATKENPDGIRIPLSDWRGSPFVGTGSYKCIPSFHPAYILRAAGDIAYFRSDVSRAVRHSAYKDLRATSRTGLLRPTLQDVLDFLHNLRTTRTCSAFDIEGYSDAVGVTMLSIAPTPTSGIVIPFYVDGRNYWTDEEEPIVWQALSGWLADPSCPKIAHNAFYETLVLGWRHQCVVAGIVSDTMMKHWEMFNELEKSLGVCTSMWIEEPYYKDDRESQGTQKLLYNFKDSACTKGIDESIEPHLLKKPRSHEHFKFNVSLINAFTYMHLRGCRFDTGRAAEHLTKARLELAVLSDEINKVLQPILGHEFNVKSTDDKRWFLYDHLKLKPYQRYGETTKEEVLHRYFKKTQDPTLKRIIQAVSLRTRISDIEKLTPNSDGRIRTSYDLVAAVTGRLNSRESSIAEQAGTNKAGRVIYTDFGTNLQNVTQPLRDCFTADDDSMLMWQADLEGADAWTVAADLAACGDDRMLQDLLHGVKPSKLLLAMLQEIEAGRDPSVIARLDSAAAKLVCDAIIVPEGTLADGRPANWKYTCMKRVQHGTNYLGMSETISSTIFKDSDGVIDVHPVQIDSYQRLYRLRYNVDLRKNYITKTLIENNGVLQTAAGVSRKFFAIRNPRNPEDDIIRQAMASEPQTNTTYCTNLALRSLWNDPANRRKSGALFIEPFLQTHDALAGQFPVRLRDFARERIKSYFHNEIVINGIKLIIPADVRVGRSWGTCKEKI